ncbi:SusC/RagA family TonB-linked outer membrane protein [Candidatus Sulfidibacterium hydrothermale]|uniref:SusC/RagA family TonB-linked outer membrane protein n=1 Tax=Candidatus Sulfidibacterium hydrothermale TaxID=2875962 RepID=UPI001F0AD8E1|nr:SusC/RagA family TonB-linked outer membrane protein [Candidatus Sulfidibacterium hydrothermale]UBM63031.1 SusC/RagA family TonB-linked outer membrane protein [Candidatus Sulfidibacterium hydrothermale]
MRKITFMFVFLLFAGLNFAWAQTRTIHGKVTSSEDGLPIPGVTVKVKGTTVGTTTNLDGKYALEVKAGQNTLVFSYVGMKTQEVTLGNSNVVNVVLHPDVLQIDQVVVTAIGITKEKKALGYNVQDVTAKEIAKSGNTDVVNALQGRVSGVTITQASGAAGGATYITIRGATSIIGNNQPLFVVDGVPIDNSGGAGGVAGVATSNRVQDLNPDDIASVSVLKGGAATALYGIRGANGVIVITTKKGKSTKGKKINVTFNSSVTIQKISQVPDLNTEYAQGWSGQWYSGFFASWGPKISESGYSKDPSVWYYPGFDVDGAIVPKDQADPSLGPVKVYDQFDFFQTGVTNNNFLSLSGGNDKSTFYISASDLRDEGVIPNNLIRRNTFKVSGSSELSDRFKISGNANYLIDNGERIQQGSNTSGVMLGLMRTPPTFNNAAGYEFPDGTQRNYRHGGGYDNPYWTANKNLYNDKVNRIIGNLQMDYFVTDWLHLMFRPGVDYYNRYVKSHIAIGSRTYSAGQVTVSSYNHFDLNSDLIAYMNWNLSENTSMYANVGFNMQQRKSNYVWGQANGLSIPDFYNLSNSPNIQTGESTYEKRMMGVFFDVGVSYKNMLYLNVTGRNDWSTTLPEENNSFFYPSINGSFILSQLPFLKGNKVLPYVKIYSSYAITANDAAAYRTLTYYGQAGISDGWVSPSGVNFPITTDGVSYNGFTYGNTMGSNDLKPERTRTFEIGTNLKFVNNRLGLDFSYFNNLSTDLLLPVDIDPSTGFYSMYENAASMSSKGFEFTLYATPIKTKNFSWDIQVNFSRIKNVVESLAPNVNSIFLGGFTDPQVRAVAGEEYGTIYGYDWQRDANGNVLIDDNTGYPAGDYTMKPLGKVNPDWTMGISNSFHFFNFTVYALLDIRQGNKMWNGTRGALDFFGAAAETMSRDDDYVFSGIKAHWEDGVLVPDDGNPVNDIVVKLDQTWRTSGEGSGFTGPTVDYIEDASWVRLRELTISYSFNKMLKGTFVDNLEIYFTGRNLWLSTPYTGIDPETSLLGASNAQGMDYFNMPGTKSYLFGVRWSF